VTWIRVPACIDPTGDIREPLVDFTSSRRDRGAQSIRGVIVKFMAEYKHRLNGSATENSGDLASMLEVFSKWAPAAGYTIEMFVERVDATGGYILVETNEPDSVLEFAAQFAPWNDSLIVPVVPVEQAVPALEKAAEWRRQAGAPAG